MLSNFSCFCCRLLTFSKKCFTICIRVSNIYGPDQDISECQTFMDPDQDKLSVSPDLGPNCSERLSEDDKSCHMLFKTILVQDHLTLCMLETPN